MATFRTHLAMSSTLLITMAIMRLTLPILQDQETGMILTWYGILSNELRLLYRPHHCPSSEIPNEGDSFKLWYDNYVHVQRVTDAHSFHPFSWSLATSHSASARRRLRWLSGQCWPRLWSCPTICELSGQSFRPFCKIGTWSGSTRTRWDTKVAVLSMML